MDRLSSCGETYRRHRASRARRVVAPVSVTGAGRGVHHVPALDVRSALASCGGAVRGAGWGCSAARGGTGPRGGRVDAVGAAPPGRGVALAAPAVFFLANKRYTIRDYTRYLYIDLKILRRGGSVARPSLLKIHSQPVARGLRRPLATRQRHEIWAPARRCGVSRRSAGSTTSAACPPTPPRPHGHVDRPPTRGCAR